VVWCDAQYACYDGQTCCRGPSGLWTCCPLYQVCNKCDCCLTWLFIPPPTVVSSLPQIFIEK
uniref:Uncharacterized protein n=1 Tax=Leptobrachium leishanense TaxID=445787 RepID=A0A8C5QRR3_9ANUR